jgi:hypothetical protein
VIVLVLGAGPPSGGLPPLLLLENDGQLLVERLARSCDGLSARLVFAARQEDIAGHRIDRVIRLAAPDAEIVAINGDTAGAACTALLCIRSIQPDAELLVLSGNEFIDTDFKAVVADFRLRRLDAGIIVFPSIHPRYAHVRLENDLVVEASEKHPISHDASAGFTWFRKGGDFISAAQAMIRNDAHVDGRFFISLTLNELVLRGRRIGVKSIDPRHYHPLKSLQQMNHFETEVLASV